MLNCMYKLGTPVRQLMLVLQCTDILRLHTELVSYFVFSRFLNTKKERVFHTISKETFIYSSSNDLDINNYKYCCL